MEVNFFTFPNKRIRAKVIKEYMHKYGYEKAVCFSCGNATRELKRAGVNVLDISPTGDLQALKWYTMGDIKQTFPSYFDATSGHLPYECMLWIAQEYKKYLGDIPQTIYLPTGSGETLVCLKLAYPKSKIKAVYNLNSATAYEKGAPLNSLVRLLADDIINAGAKEREA